MEGEDFFGAIGRDEVRTVRCPYATSAGPSLTSP